MKLATDRSSLLKALSHVQSVVERRTTIPILSNVHLEAKGQEVRLTATDMDIAISETIPANIEEEGSTTAPAHMLYDIMRKLPEDVSVNLDCNAEKARLTVSAADSKFELSCLPVDEFPVIAEEDFTIRFVIPAKSLSNLLEKVRFAISTEETRYYLNGIYFHAAGNDNGQVLRSVATDGHRLAQMQVSIPEGAAGMPGIIIPRKTVNELKKLLEETPDAVGVAVSENKIRFECRDAVLMSKLIDGNFPDYERVIPSGNDRRMDIDSRKFAEAVDRVSTISSEKTRAVKFTIAPGVVTLTAHSPEQGNATETVAVNYESEPIEIGFNSRYVLDIMGQMEEGTAHIQFGDGASPALIRDPANDGALYVLMPMRV